MVKAPSQENNSVETAGKSAAATKNSGVSGKGKRSSFPVIQTKLAVGASDDPYEKEADQMADQVTQKPGGSFIQQKESTEKEKEKIRKKSLSSSQPLNHASDQTTAQIAQAKGKGAALDRESRSFMEERFGTDFSQVKIHKGQEASRMNNEMGSRAFTVGNDVFFNEGEYQPNSDGGKHLLAHELTHVLQQNGSGGSEKQVSRAPRKIQRGLRSALGRVGRGAAGLASGAANRVVGAGRAVVNTVAEGIAAAKDYLLRKARDLVSSLPGYKALSVILGKDIITGEVVERNGRNFIEAGLDIIPGGNLLKAKLEEKGIMTDASIWLDGLILELSRNISDIKDQIRQLINNVSPTSIRSTLSRIERIIRSTISAVVNFAVGVATGLLKIIKDFLISELIDFIKEQTNAYPLLTVILGKDPISGEEVERTPLNLFTGVMQLSDEGEEQLRQMEESGALARAIEWVDGAVERLDINSETIREAFNNAWQLITIENLMQPVETFRQLYNIFAPPVGRIINFIIEVAVKVLGFIKDALLRRLTAFAQRVPGYNLMRVILGRDPFTSEVVPRTVENIIFGFMTLIPGGEEKFNELKESGAIERISTWLDGALERLNITWNYIVGLFLEIWNSFSLSDLAAPLEAFQRVVNYLAEPVGRIVAFLFEVIKKIVEIVLVIMNFPVDLIQQIVANAMQAYEDIKRDPIAFFKNLLGAVKQGFVQFFGNIGQHFIGGLTGWLFGELQSAGVSPPTDLSFRSIFGFVIDVLGITANRIFEKIAQKIGPERMERIRSMAGQLEGAWNFVTDVVTRGPIAIWEKIQQQLSNLWNIVLDKIKDWVMVRVIQQVTAKILSFFDPTGIMAVINSFIAFYRAVQSFIERLREILEVINSFVGGVAEIASGSIETAANFLENAMGRAMPVIIAFLANQAGLRGIGRRVGEIIAAIRERVDTAIDWLIDQAIRAGSALLEARRGAVEGVMNWWNARKRFRTDSGEEHTLYFEGEEDSADLMMASTPKKFIDHINALEQQDLTPEQETKLETAKELDSAIYRRRREEDGYNNVVELLNQLAEVSAGLLIGGKPASVIEYGSGTSEGGATFADAKVLAKGTHVAGSVPSDAPPIWQKANRRKISQVFIRGHLLNHNIGGPGHAYNLTPITGNGAGFGNNYANKVHHDKVEKYVKDAYDDDNVVRYRVDAVYGKHPDRPFQQVLRNRIDTSGEQERDRDKLDIMNYEQNNLTLAFLTRWCKLEQENGQWEKEVDVKEEIIENELPDGDFEIK